MKNLTTAFVSAGIASLIVVAAFQFNPVEKTKIIVKEDQSTETAEQELPVSQVAYTPTNYSAAAAVDFTEAAENSLNAVVHIKTVVTRDLSGDPFYRFFYGNNAQLKSRGSGSGVIISPDGYIATNNHVIAGADEIKVTLNNTETYTGTIIGTDPSTDLALIKINKEDLSYLNFANSDEVKVGQWALAVGNPFNLTSTVTAGIVSAKARSINILKSDYQNEVFPIESFIQTDAAVNPGNSGGALVNTKGELIGINTAIASKTGSYSGYSFAVPANLVKKVTTDLAEYGSVKRGFMGVSLMDITTNMLDKFALDNVEGVFVANVAKGGAAQEAGILSGDVIVKIEDKEIKSVPQLQEQIGNYHPGDKVAVTIKRNGTLHTVTVVLKNLEGETPILRKQQP